MREIHEIDTLEAYLERNHQLRDCVFQGLNLGKVKVDWDQVRVSGAVFLGCLFPSLAFQERFREGGALVFPRLPRIPFDAYSPCLYTRQELIEGWSSEDDQSLDKKIYDHFVKEGRHNLQKLAGDRQYARYLTLSDDPEEVVSFIETHPPEPYQRAPLNGIS